MVASVYLFYSFKYIKSQFLLIVCQKKVSTCLFGLFTNLHLCLIAHDLQQSGHIKCRMFSLQVKET